METRPFFQRLRTVSKLVKDIRSNDVLCAVGDELALVHWAQRMLPMKKTQYGSACRWYLVNCTLVEYRVWKHEARSTSFKVIIQIQNPREHRPTIAENIMNEATICINTTTRPGSISVWAEDITSVVLVKTPPGQDTQEAWKHHDKQIQASSSSHFHFMFQNKTKVS